MKLDLESAPVNQGPLLALADRLRLLLAGSSGRRRVAANSGWLLFDKLVRAVLGLLVGAWVARHLGPDDFGTLAYVLAYIAIFQPIASLCADAIVVRNVSQAPTSAPQVLGTAFAIRLALGAACWLLAIAGAALFGAGDGQLVVLTAVIGGTLVFQAADVVDLWFQSQSQSRRTVVAKLVAYAASSGTKVALIVGGAPLLAFALVTAVEGMLCAAALCVAYRGFRTEGAWSAARPSGIAMISEAWPFMLSGVAIMIYMRVDQIMIKELLGPAQLGIYAVALPISQFWQVLPMTIAASVAPFVARQRLDDQVGYRRSMVLAFRWFFYLGVLSALITFAVSGWLVPVLFGESYASAVLILDLHAISNVFCFLGIAHNLWLVNERRFAVRLYGTVAAALSTMALNYLLLPRVGLPGACIAAIVAQAIATFLINGVLDRSSFRLQIEAITFRKT